MLLFSHENHNVLRAFLKYFFCEQYFSSQPIRGLDYLSLIFLSIDLIIYELCVLFTSTDFYTDETSELLARTHIALGACRADCNAEYTISILIKYIKTIANNKTH